MSDFIFEPQEIEPEDDYDLHYLSKIDICIEVIFTLIGNGLCLMVINYEQFGGDPMKRSIVNKLISSLGMAQIVGMLLSATSLLFRAFIGPFNLILTLTILFIMGSLNHFACLILMLIYSYKCLNILAFNASSHLNEEFWFILSQILCLLLSITFTLTSFFLHHLSFPLICAYAGMPIPPMPSSNFSFFLVGVGALLMLLSHFIISIFEVIKHEQSSSIHRFNNFVHNPSVINDLPLLGSCTFFAVAGFLPILIYEGQAPETADEVFLYWLPARWVFGFFNPALVVYYNPKIIAHVKREFWDYWAPDWLQRYNPYLIEIGAARQIV